MVEIIREHIEGEAEKVLLLGLSSRRIAGELDPEASLHELAGLTETAGGVVIGASSTLRRPYTNSPD